MALYSFKGSDVVHAKADVWKQEAQQQQKQQGVTNKKKTHTDARPTLR
jgi:hypothetical protein